MSGIITAAVITSAASACAHPDPVRMARSDATTSATPAPSPTHTPIVSPPAPPPPSPVVPLRETRARPAPAETSSNAAIAREILRIFGPVHGPEALGVFDCESGDHDGHAPYTFSATQISSSDDWGVAQVHREWDHEATARRLGYSWHQMLEVVPNLTVAHEIFLESKSTWGQWTCRWAA